MQIESKKYLSLLSEALETHKVILKMNQDHLVSSDDPDTPSYLIKIEMDLITADELLSGINHNLNEFKYSSHG